MRLAEALRLADEMELPDLRKKFMEMRVDRWGGEKPPCCAVGGANIAAGNAVVEVDGSLGSQGMTWARVGSEITTVTGFDDARWLKQARLRCPVKDCDAYYANETGTAWVAVISPWQLVIHLYDEHLWSRTQIAEWLDAIHGPKA